MANHYALVHPTLLSPSPFCRYQNLFLLLLTGHGLVQVTAFLGVVLRGWGHGKMLLRSFADLSSMAVRDNDTPLIGTHSLRLEAGS